MKLQRKGDKTKKVIIIVAIVVAAIVLVALAGLAILSMFNEEIDEKGIDKISVYSLPSKTTNYLGEEFDPTGLKIQVITNNTDYNYFVDYEQLTCSGFDSSTVNESLTITVSYKGYSETFTVKVIERPVEIPHIVDIELVGFKTTYTMEKWNTSGPSVIGATINRIYSDGSIVEGLPLQKKWIYGGESIVDAPGTLDITIKYNDNGTLIEKVVTITITN